MGWQPRELLAPGRASAGAALTVHKARQANERRAAGKAWHNNDSPARQRSSTPTCAYAASADSWAADASVMPPGRRILPHGVKQPLWFNAIPAREAPHRSAENPDAERMVVAACRSPNPTGSQAKEQALGRGEYRFLATPRPTATGAGLMWLLKRARVA